MLITAERYHDISCGHRVAGHESKCSNLHGHNYRITFTLDAPLDGIGRVLDFSVIKERLCAWLEANWDHRFLAWEEDALMREAVSSLRGEAMQCFGMSVVWVPFNPTAENMAEFLITEVCPNQLRDTEARVIMVRVEETRKCSATVTI